MAALVDANTVVCSFLKLELQFWSLDCARFALLESRRQVRTLERLTHANIVSYKHAWLELHRASEFCPYVPCAAGRHGSGPDVR